MDKTDGQEPGWGRQTRHYARKSLMTPEKRDVGFSIIEGVKYSDHPL